MKKTMLCLIIALFACITVTSVSFAATALSPNPVAIAVSAKIDAVTPAISVSIFKNGTPATGTDVTSNMKLEFRDGTSTGSLLAGNGVWYSSDWYTVLIVAQGYGKQYEVRSTCSGIGTIPNDATHNYFVLTGVYSETDKWLYPDGSYVDQGPKPAAAKILGSTSYNPLLPPKTNAIGTYKAVYTSEPAVSTPRLVQAIYSIPDKPTDGSVPYAGWTGLPLTQAAATYSGTVTISIVAI